LEALGDLFIEFGGEGRVGVGSEFLQLAQTTQPPFPGDRHQPDHGFTVAGNHNLALEACLTTRESWFLASNILTFMVSLKN
jgi:hypothetical protein